MGGLHSRNTGGGWVALGIRVAATVPPRQRTQPWRRRAARGAIHVRGDTRTRARARARVRARVARTRATARRSTVARAVPASGTGVHLRATDPKTDCWPSSLRTTAYFRGSAPSMVALRGSWQCCSRRPAASRSPSTAAERHVRPVADPAAVVLCSATTRLTLLSPLFALSMTLHRNSRTVLPWRLSTGLPVPVHAVRNTSTWCNVTLTDSNITISYHKLALDPEGSSLLSGGLQVRTATGAVMWAGLDAARASANLGGTVYDLKGQNGSLCGKEMMGMEICAPGSHIDLTCGGNQKTFGDGASYCTHGVLATACQPGHTNGYALRRQREHSARI